jgi:hypothetical protein
MKRNLFLASLLVCSSVLMAQTHEDALLFSDNSIAGTARSAGMGNAFGALGADISSLSINPAGLGVYRSYDFSLTTNLGMREITTYYNGNKTVDAAGNFNISSLGFILPYKRSKEGDWRRTNIGFAYNKTNIFKSNTTIRGYSNTSIVDVFHNYAQGAAMEDLNPFYESGAFWTDLIDLSLDTAGDWVDDGNYYREVDAGQYQYKHTSVSGSMGEFAMSYAGSYKERLYLGATLGFTSIEYAKKSRYNESGFADDSTTVQSFYLYENVYTSGGGVNLKLGGILRVNDNLRLGLAWHSPTYYSLQDEWEMMLDVNHELNDSAYSYSYTSPYGMYNYDLKTPMKLVTSAAVVLNKKLVLSADLEYLDYGTMQLSGDRMDYEYFDAENEAITTYTASYNTRLGAELNLTPIILRAGYAHYGSPIYINEGPTLMMVPQSVDRYRTEKQSWSVGLGKRNDYSYVDFAYVFTEDVRFPLLYRSTQYKSVNSYHNIMLTMGWKF